MKSLPPGLPPASSTTWHSRRWWDQLGHLRVRSLANPRWRRDVPWLIRWLHREAPPVGGELRPLYEAAIAAAVRCPRTSAGRGDREASWDELLTRIDDILVRRQHDHLDAVRSAGASGHDVPPARPQRWHGPPPRGRITDPSGRAPARAAAAVSSRGPETVLARTSPPVRHQDAVPGDGWCGAPRGRLHRWT